MLVILWSFHPQQGNTTFFPFGSRITSHYTVIMARLSPLSSTASTVLPLGLIPCTQSQVHQFPYPPLSRFIPWSCQWSFPCHHNQDLLMLTGLASPTQPCSLMVFTSLDFGHLLLSVLLCPCIPFKHIYEVYHSHTYPAKVGIPSNHLLGVRSHLSAWSLEIKELSVAG